MNASKFSSVVLVGYANCDRYQQVSLGTFGFELQKTDFSATMISGNISMIQGTTKLIPVIAEYSHSDKKFVKTELTNINIGSRESFDAPKAMGGEGFSIFYVDETFRFSTGIHSGWQSGMSGIMAPESAEAVFELLRLNLQGKIEL